MRKGSVYAALVTAFGARRDCANVMGAPRLSTVQPGRDYDMGLQALQ